MNRRYTSRLSLSRLKHEITLYNNKTNLLITHKFLYYAVWVNEQQNNIGLFTIIRL